MTIKLRSQALVLAMAMAACGDDAASPAGEGNDDSSADADSGLQDAGRMDGAVHDASAAKDAGGHSDAAAHDAAAVQSVDASSDASTSEEEDAGDVMCFIDVCSNPFDCVRNLDNCGKVTCMDNKCM